MSKTLANLRTGTRVYVDEASQADFLDSEVDIAINWSYHDVVSNVIEVYEEFYATVTPFAYAMVKDQQEYGIDSSLIKVSRVEINYTPSASGSVAIRAVPIKKDELRLNLANTASSGTFFNAAYYLHGSLGSQKVGFVPIPSNSDTGSGKSISVWGIQLPGDLVNSTDDVNIPYADRFSSLVCLGAAVFLLRKGQQEEAAAARYVIDYESGIKKMREFLKDRQADDVWLIEDSVLEDVNFGGPTNL